MVSKPPAKCSTKVESLADLKLVVNDPQGPIQVGEETTYEICISNRGTKAATEVQVLAQFSEGIEPVNVEGGKADRSPAKCSSARSPRSPRTRPSP